MRRSVPRPAVAWEETPGWSRGSTVSQLGEVWAPTEGTSTVGKVAATAIRAHMTAQRRDRARPAEALRMLRLPGSGCSLTGLTGLTAFITFLPLGLDTGRDPRPAEIHAPTRQRQCRAPVEPAFGSRQEPAAGHRCTLAGSARAYARHNGAKRELHHYSSAEAAALASGMRCSERRAKGREQWESIRFALAMCPRATVGGSCPQV